MTRQIYKPRSAVMNFIQKLFRALGGFFVYEMGLNALTR
jgi:hypothetical protein